MKNLKLKFNNVCVTEDSEVEIEEGVLDSYKWRGYINKDGMSSVVSYEVKDDGVCGEIDEVFKEFVSCDEEWFSENEEDREKVLKGLNDLREMLFSSGGVLVSWSVEYDRNLMVIWKELYDEDGELIDENVCYDDGKEGMEWYNREYDESEFESE